MATTVYTDEMLDHNFRSIQTFMDTAGRAIEKHADVLEELRKQAPAAASVVVRTHKRSKLLVIGVVAASVYVGYKVAKNEYKIESNLSDLAAKKPANTQTQNTEKD